MKGAPAEVSDAPMPVTHDMQSRDMSLQSQQMPAIKQV
jgi:hypothetical protein